jgi:chaperone required for assembly of F1-ATPase
MKRFYKTATYNEQSGQYFITLDERPITTPGRHILNTSTESLAKEVCAEWVAQGDDIIPDSMPITQYCYTALDYVSKHRTEITATILNFLNTDLLCYRADKPQELIDKQNAAWDPYLNWFNEYFDQNLETTTGLQALSQDDDAHDKVKAHVDGLDTEQLTIAQFLTASCGSLIMALCFVNNDTTCAAMFNAAFVEELHQGEIHEEERFGVDPIQEKQRARLTRDLKAAETFLSCLKRN